MPIYKVNGETYDIPASKQEAFEKRYPDASVSYINAGDTYEIPLNKRDAFLKRYPDAYLTSLEVPSTEQPKAAYSPTHNYGDGSDTNARVRMFNDKPNPPLNTVRGFGKAAAQRLRGLGAGVQNLWGEFTNIFTGSSRDDANALAEFDRMMSEGIDVNDATEGAWTHLERELRTGALEFLPGWMIKGWKQNVHDLAEKMKVLGNIHDVLSETGGDVGKARALLQQRAKDQSYGDRQMQAAAETMGEMKPTEGFGAWLGENMVQMIPSASALLIGAITRSPAAAKVVGGLGIGAMTAATSGQSMYDARQAGASDYETRKTGVVDGMIEVITEKIPFDRYTKRIVGKAKKEVAEQMARALSDKNSPAREELQELLTRANRLLGGKLFSKKTAQEYIADIMAEGASEFTAEALQTMSSIIYEEPENYPEFSEIMSNGFQALLAGAFMGSVLGGSSLALGSQQNKQRRKEQGFVKIGLIDNGDNGMDIGEIAAYDPERQMFTITDGINSYEVGRNKIKQTFDYTYEEFESARYRQLEDEAIDNGTVTDGQMSASEQRLNKERGRFDVLLSNSGLSDEEKADVFASIERGDIPALPEQSDLSLWKAAESYADAYERYADIRKARDSKVISERSELSSAIEKKVGKFWQDETETVMDNGFSVVEPKWVEFGTLADGRNVYIISGVNEDGEVAAVTEDGERLFVNNAMMPNGTRIMSLDEYLDGRLAQQRSVAEQERMSTENAERVNDVRQQVSLGMEVNLGTQEAPIMGTVLELMPANDGVLVQTEQGVAQLSWEKVADVLNVGTASMTDLEIAAKDAADILESENAWKEVTARTEQEVALASSAEEVAAVASEDAEPLPLKQDGSVDQTTLWNKSPERWARWNDEQRQDGGVNSINYINNALAKAQKDLDSVVKAYDKETDFEAREAMEEGIRAKQERVARLSALQQSYLPENAQEQAAAQVAQETAGVQSPATQAEPSQTAQALPAPEQTIYDLFSDESLSEDEIEAYIDANVAGSQSDLDKHLNKAPKMGRDMEKYKADKAKHEEKTRELTAIRDHWRQVRAYLNPSTVEMDAEPQNALEAAAKELTRKDGISLLPESFRHHTGYGRGEQVAFLSILRKKENGGMTLEAAGERLMADYPEFFDQNDPNAGLNAILEVLQSAASSSDLYNYINNAREDVARQEADAVRSAIIQQVEETKKLSEQEISALIDNMKANAEIATEIELTPENWIAEFGENGIVETPIGEVKMGENQYLKLLQRKRAQYFGMILPTLKNPDLVLEELDPAPNGERDTKLLFIKTFIKPDGTRYVHFESVTILRDSMEISISSHEINEADLKKKMRNDKVVHLRKSLSVSEWPLNGHQNNGPDLVPSPSVMSVSEEVYNRHTTDRQSAETAEVSQDAEQGGTQSSSSMNTPTSSSIDKDSNNPAISNESEENIDGFTSTLDEDMPDFESMSDEEVKRMAIEAVVPETERQRFQEEKRNTLKDRIREWEQRLGAKVKVMDSIDDVTNSQAKAQIEKGGEVWGWFETSTGEVCIYLPDFMSLSTSAALSEIDKTYIHEIVSHKGLRGLLGEDAYGELCDMVWEAMTEQQKADFLNYPGVNGNTRTAADEFIAHFAENVDYNDNRTLWDKILDFIKDMFNSVEIPTYISNESLAELLRQSYRNLAKSAAAIDINANKQAEGNTLFRVANGSLVGIHNISEEKLRKVIKQGGSANPSTAVIDIERQAFNSYGDISFIMPSSLVDAGTGRNAGTFTADAWTPTYPQVTKRFSDDKLQRAYWRDVSAIPEEMSHEVRMAFDSWLDDRNASGLAYMFLHERGEAPEMVRVAAKFPQDIKDKLSAILGENRSGLYELSDEEKQAVLDLYIQENFGGNREEFDKSIADRIKRIEDRLSTGKVPSFVEKRITFDLQWMKEHAYDYDELSKFVNAITADIRHAGEVNDAATTNRALDYIKDNGLEKEFDKWKESLNDRYGIKQYLFDGYTPSGNQRWLPNTVENASRLMNKQGLAGATGMAASFNRFVATLAPKKKTLSEIRASKDRLVEDDKLVDDFREKWSEVFFDLGVKCQPDAKGYEDYGFERLTEAAQKKNPGAYLKKEYGVELSQEELQKLSEMIKAIKTEFPARYFETKFQRPVYLNEFAAAVMPMTTSEDIKQAVSEAGLPIFEYDSSVEGSRKEATLKATEGEGIRFRTAPSDRVLTLFNQARAGELGGKPISIGSLTKEGKEYLERISGIKLKENVSFVLNPSDLNHIYNDHYGKNEKDTGNNIPLNDYDIRRLVDVIAFPTRVVFGEDKQGRKVFYFLSETPSGTYNLMEIYANKKGNLTAKTYYKTKKGATQRVMELESLLSTSETYSGATLSDAKIPILFDIANQEEGNTRFRITPEQDAAYMKAVEAGDMETAQRMVNEAAKLAGYNSNSDYQGSLAFNGAAPSGYAYYDTKEERIEAWENGEYEDDQTLGDYKDAGIDISNLGWSLTSPVAQRMGNKYTRESIKNLADAVNSDSRKIKVYRAVDADIKEDSIRNGDWVTPSRAYAEHHIRLQDWKEGRIIEQEVDIDDIWWDGNDINEWGYNDGKGYAYKNTPNNRKLLDPVTYDDKGNVIPLSERFNEEKSDIRFRTTNNNQAIFVSNAAKAVEGIKMEKATPEQWLAMIEKNGGLKAGEDKWMGLSDWLKASKAKTLTKAEVLEFINENMIIIEEEKYGEVELSALQEEFNAIYDNIIDNVGNEDESELQLWEVVMNPMERTWEELRDRYSGGDDFDMAFSYDSYGNIEVNDPDAAGFFLGIKPINDTRLDYTTSGLQNKQEIALVVPNIEPWNERDDVHFGDAGEGRAVAWIRFGETTDEFGRRVLVIDEIQSKRHQEGREKGYRTSREDVAKATEAFQSFNRTMKEKYGENVFPSKWSEEDQAEFDRLRDEHARVSKSYDKGIPDAPFDKNWHELAMKRMLRYAAEEGYDVIAWTKGEQQAERYNLSHLVKRISVSKPTEDGSRIVNIHYRDEYDDFKNLVVDADGKIVHGEYAGNTLADVVGKEIALQIMNSEEATEFKGEGLKVGGEGMRGFYDKMLPAFMNKYGKKWGVKVEDIELPNLEKSARIMHSVPVTEEMKASVMEGQVMFRATGITPEVREEMAEIKESAERAGTYLKAPNGADTNLTAEQWALVRTKAFKAWFGDWEKAARIQKLRNSEPVMMDGNEHEGKYELNRESAQRYILDELRDTYTIADTNERIKIVKRGAKKVTSHSMGNDAHMRSIAIIPEIIKSAIFITEMSADKADAQYDSYRYYVCGLEYAGESYTVKMTVGVKNGDYYYDHTLTDIEKGKLLDMIESQQGVSREGFTPTGNESDPSYALSDIKDKKLVSILQTNASKVVDANGEPMVVYHGTLAKNLTRFDKDFIGSRYSYDEKGFFFISRESIANDYATPDFGTGRGAIIPAFINLKNPLFVDQKWTAKNGLGNRVFKDNDVIEFWDNYQTLMIEESQNNDGVIISDGTDLMVVAFEPSQIKSATDNTGEFSADNNDIRFRTKYDVNTNPTEAQKKAGNYKMGHIRLDGYNITIENPKGSVRRGTDSKGNAWENTLNNDYGYIRGTEGVDGDHIDVYLSDNPSEGNVFVIDQVNPQTREFDEHKVMYGFNSAEEAREAYLANFSEGWNGLGTITEVSKDEFKKWIESSHRKTKPFSEYKSVKTMGGQSESYNEEVFFNGTGTPTEDVVARGLEPSRQDAARLAGDIYSIMPADIRKQVSAEALNNGMDLQKTIFQISASLAEKDSLSDEETAFAKSVADILEQRLLNDGVEMTRPLTTSEALWMLWRNSNPVGEDDVFGAARRAVVADNLGMSTRFRAADKRNDSDNRSKQFREATASAAADAYNRSVSFWKNRLKESYVDNMDSVNILVEAIEKASGKAAQGWEDIRLTMNQLSSKGLSAMEKFIRDYLHPMWDAVEAIMKKMDIDKADVERYIMLESGLERNEVFAKRDAKAKHQDEYDKQIRSIEGMEVTDEEKAALKVKAKNTLDRRLAAVDAGTDATYKKMRERDYGAVMAQFAEYAPIKDQSAYGSLEEYNRAKLNSRRLKYSTVEEAESAAWEEINAFRQKAGEELIDNLWKRINAATKATLKQQYEANMLSKAQYDHIRGMFKYYVPMRGFADNTAEDMYSYYANGQNDFAAPVLKAKGRTTMAESPLGHIGAMASSGIAQGLKNEAKLALYYFVLNRPNDLISVDKTWYVDTGRADEEGKAIFEAKYPPMTGALSEEKARADYEKWQNEMKELEKQGKAVRGSRKLDLKNSVIHITPSSAKEHTITVKVGGEEITMFINGNPRAAQAVNGLLNIEASDKFEGMRKYLRFLSSVNTSFNPEFWMTNLQRDMLFTAMAISSKEDAQYNKAFQENYWKAWKAVTMVRKDKNGTLGDSHVEQLFKEFVENGGPTGYTKVIGNEEWEKTMNKYLSRKDRPKVESIRKAFDALQSFSEGIEQVSRFAAYMTSREMGRSVQQSISDAKEVTVNFNRKGSGQEITKEEADRLTDENGQPLSELSKFCIRMISKISPYGRGFLMFFNASVQGLNSFVRLTKNNPKAMSIWASGYLMLGILNASLHAMLDDDDEYLDIPDYERRTSLLLGGNGAYFKWALPQEARAFYALGDLFVNRTLDRMPHQNVVWEATKILFDVAPLNPTEGVAGVLPPFFATAVELWTNKDYKGAKIRKDMAYLSDEAKKGVPEYTKTFSGTSEVAVALSRAINWLSGGDYATSGYLDGFLTNPAVMQHVVESQLGGTLRTINKTLDTIWNIGGLAVGSEDAEFTVRNTPFLNRLLTINDERYRNSHTTDLYKHYKGVAANAKRREKEYSAAHDSENLNSLRSSEDYAVFQIYQRHKKVLDMYDKQLKLARNEQERRLIMQRQDAERKRMIEEISRL